MVVAAVGEDGEISSDIRRFGLQKQMIVEGSDRQAFKIPASDADVRLAQLELKIDLIADIGVETIDLLGVCKPPREYGCPRRP